MANLKPKPMKTIKIIQTLNYIFLINAMAGLGFVVTYAIWLQNFNLLVTIETVISFVLFVIGVKFENRLKEKFSKNL